MKWEWLKSRKCRRMILGFISGTILLAAVVYALDCALVRRQLRDYRETLRRQGAKLTNEEIVASPSKEELVAGSNLFVICHSLEGISNGPSIRWKVNSKGHGFSYSKIPGWVLYQPSLRFQSSIRVTPPRPRPTGVTNASPAPTVHENDGWQELAEQIEAKREDFEKLALLLERGQIGFPVSGRDSGATNIDALVRVISEVRDAELVHLHDGKFELAHRDAMTVMRLAKLVYSRRNVFRGYQPIKNGLIASWEYLQYPQWSDSQLRELQSAWEGFDFLQSAKQDLLVNRNAIASEVDDVRHHWPFRCLCDLMDEFDKPGKAFLSILEHGEFDMFFYRYPYYWDWILRRSYVDERHALENYQFWIKIDESLCSGAPGFPTVPDATRRYDETHNARYWKLDLSSWADKVSDSRFNRVFARQATKEMAVISIALKRFYCAHQAYPATLAELSPQYLSKIPLDPVLGQPFQYSLDQTDGYRLYSVGMDGRDDGGIAVSDLSTGRPSYLDGHRPEKFDWVWPTPATAEEVAAVLEGRDRGFNR